MTADRPEADEPTTLPGERGWLMIVHTQDACRPSAQAARMRWISSGLRSALSTTVCTGVRPGGSWSMTETSRSA